MPDKVKLLNDFARIPDLGDRLQDIALAFDRACYHLAAETGFDPFVGNSSGDHRKLMAAETVFGGIDHQNYLIDGHCEPIYSGI